MTLRPWPRTTDLPPISHPNLSFLDGHTMPLHTVALGAALTPTVLHTLINHVSFILCQEAMH